MKTRTQRAAIFSFMVALLALGVWYVMRRTDGFAKRVTDTTTFQIDLLTANNTQMSQAVDISGHTTLRSSITLLLNGLPYSQFNTADDGSFTISNIIVPTRNSNIRVEARTRIGFRSFEARRELNIWLTPGVVSGTVKRNDELPASGAKVIITNLGAQARDRVPLYTFTDKDGKFFIPELVPNNYQVVTWSQDFLPDERNFTLPRASKLDIGEIVLKPGVSEEPVSEGEQPSQPIEAVRQLFLFDSAKVPSAVSRKVTANVSYRSLILTLDSVLMSDDKRVGILYGGDNPIPPKYRTQHFIREVFNDFQIGFHTLSEFTWKLDFPDCKDGRCSIRVVSEPYNILFSNKVDQNWVVTTNWHVPRTDNDSFVLAVKDYELQESAPHPRSTSGTIATWTNLQPERNIRFKLAFSTLTGGGIFRIFGTSAYDLAPRSLSPAIRFLLNFLIAIPMICIFWFLRKYGDVRRIKKYFSDSSKLLIILSISIPFFSAVYYFGQVISSYLTIIPGKPLSFLQPAFLYFFDVGIFSTTNDLRLLLIGACTVGAVIGLALIAVFTMKERTVSTWLRVTLMGAGVAALINIILVVFLGLAQWLFDPNFIGVAQLLTTVFNGVFLFLLTLVILRAIKLSAPWRLTNKITLLLFFLVLLMAFPGSPFNIFNTPVPLVLHNAVRSEVERFFRLIQYLAPYLPLVLLIPILKQEDNYQKNDLHFLKGVNQREDDPIRVDQQPEDKIAFGRNHLGESREVSRISRKIILGVGVILFSGYLVGTNSKWLILPIPFFLSLWLFRSRVMRPIRKQVAFDQVTTEVIERRQELLTTAKRAFEIQPLRDSLHELKKQKGLSPIEYDKKREEIEGYIQALEERGRLTSRVSIREAVLGIGPVAKNWNNGLWSVRYGLIVALPLVAIRTWQFLATDLDALAHYKFLSVGSFVLMNLAYWLVSAFFFGYFFKYLVRDSGLRKGLNLAIIISLCLAVSEITLNLSVFVARCAELVYFFSALGLWGFDYHNFRRSLRDQFTWRSFYEYENLSTLDPAYKIVGAALTLVFTGAATRVILIIISQFVSPNFPKIAKLFGAS